MLIDFLKGIKVIYGKHIITSNIHNLCHLVGDVERFGSLDTFWTYTFESQLFYLKRLIRTGNLPLSQVARRITEIQQSFPSSTTRSNKITTKFRCLNTDYSKFSQTLLQFIGKSDFNVYSQAYLKKIFLNGENDTDKWILTSDLKVFCVEKIIQHSTNTVFLFGSYLNDIDNFFEKPVPSSALQIYKSCLRKDSIQVIPMTKFYSKLVKVKSFEVNTYVFTPLIHTIT